METKHILDNLHKYMFLHDVYRTMSNNNDSKDFFINKNLDKDHCNDSGKKDIFVPGERDKLFWCFYIIKHGIDHYLSIGQNHFQIETKFKISTAEKLSECEILLKQNKLKRPEVENELVNEKKISMYGMKALCVIYKVDIMFIFEKTFYKICGLSENKTAFIKTTKQDDYGIVENIDKETLDTIMNKYYEIEDYSKPIKSVSAYKLDQLKVIAEKLDIKLVDAIGNKKTKKILYEEITTIL